MGLWKITDNGPAKVARTEFKSEELLEEHLERWIEQDPSILGEPLLIIGRQVVMPDTKDRLDLLALDPHGNAVIIELKRGKLSDPVDMQALRYASYISRWEFENFEAHARPYLNRSNDPKFNFNAVFEEFCQEHGTEETPELNGDQRAIIVGGSVRERLGSVALWLFEHGIDLKVVEVHAYKDGANVLIEPSTVVPQQVSRFGEVGRVQPGKSPWVSDGRAWHLEKRCNPGARDMLLKLDEVLQEHFDAEGPRWNQKHYVAYKINNYNWLAAITMANGLWLDILVGAGAFESDRVAEDLGVQVFDKSDSLSDKLGLPSSVHVKNLNANVDKIIFRVKEEYDLGSERFLSFLKKTREAFPK